MNKSEIEKQNIKLLKSLDINVTNLRGYNKLYNTTPDTLGYKHSNMWAYSINRNKNNEVCRISCNSTYFKLNEKTNNFNLKHLKNL